MTEPTGTARCNILALIVCLVWAASPVRGATLIGKFTPIPTGTDVNLTAEGPLDWVHWGLYTDSSLDRKAGVTPQIPDFTPKGFTGPFQFADNYNGYSWSDGTPTSSATNTPTGVWMYGKPNGFELQFQADTTLKTLKIYVGTFGAVGAFTATLGALKYTDTSISNKSWGYINNDTFKSPQFVIHQLIDIVSKNGNLLLNIGPRSDGTIPEEVQQVLIEVGAWLKVNGEAIYGTRPWKVYGEGPTKVAAGSFHDTDTATYTPEDFRFTTKGNTLYALELGWSSSGEAFIHALGSDALGGRKIKSVTLLGSGAELLQPLAIA